MIVLLPLPLGAEKISSFPGIVFCCMEGVNDLHHIENLFLYLFKLVLHPHHYVLHLRLVAL